MAPSDARALCQFLSLVGVLIMLVAFFMGSIIWTLSGAFIGAIFHMLSEQI